MMMNKILMVRTYNIIIHVNILLSFILSFLASLILFKTTKNLPMIPILDFYI